MNAVRYLTRLTLLQLGLMAVLAGVLIIQLMTPPETVKSSPVILKNDTTELLALPELPEFSKTLEQYQEISERPLFYSSRKPQEISTPRTALQGRSRNPQQDWILTGIILNGDDNIALFSAIGKKQHQSLKSGMKLGDWTLDQITPDSVTFTKEDLSEKMLLIKPSVTVKPDHNKSSSLFRNQSQYGKVVRPME